MSTRKRPKKAKPQYALFRQRCPSCQTSNIFSELAEGRVVKCRCGASFVVEIPASVIAQAISRASLPKKES
jgi:hypothetical protein